MKRKTLLDKYIDAERARYAAAQRLKRITKAMKEAAAKPLRAA